MTSPDDRDDRDGLPEREPPPGDGETTNEPEGTGAVPADFLDRPAGDFAAPVLRDLSRRDDRAERELQASITEALRTRYAVTRVVGRGGMAHVFAADDLRHRRPVAIKVVRPDFALRLGAARFLAEIGIAARLQHPHIVPLYDSGESGGLLYYVMPLVAGGSLRDLLRREGQLDRARVRAVVHALALALDHAHRGGVLHRDLKPENVLLQDGEPLLADFGIALALDGEPGERLTGSGVSIGTPHYMSPEQASGAHALDARSDVFALGVLAYEMLAGEPPFTGPTREAVLARLLLEPPRPLRTVRASVSTTTEAVIVQALAKRPSERFASATAFASALDVALAEEARPPAIVAPFAGKPKAPHRPLGGWWRTRRTYVAVAAALLLGVIPVLPGAAPGLRDLIAAIPGRWRDRAPAPEARTRTLTSAGRVQQAALSPDGRRLAFTVPADSGWAHLIVQDVDGGVPDTIRTARCCLTLEWAPDSERLLLTQAREAIVLSRRGVLLRDLEVTKGLPRLGFFGAWLPGGETVSLHASLDRRILLVDVATEDTTPLVLRDTTFFAMGDAAWSPDGRHVAVALRYRNPIAHAIATVSRADGSVRIVARESLVVASPRWTPDGSTIDYLRQGLRTSVLRRVRVRPDASPRDSAFDLYTPIDALPFASMLARFTPTADGSRAVFTRGDRWAHLWYVRLIAPDAAPQLDVWTTERALRWAPAVSPDGRTVAFLALAGDQAEVFARPTRKLGLQRSMTSGARVSVTSSLAWSPDGARLAFTAAPAGYPRVWLADTTPGSAVRALANTDVSDASGWIGWSDGARLAYSAHDRRNVVVRDMRDGAQSWLLARADTVRADTVRAALLDEPARGTVFELIAAPDGRLAFVWNRGRGDVGVWVADVSAGTLHQVLARAEELHGWSPDGRFLYVGFPRIERVDTRGSLPTTLAGTLPFREGDCTASPEPGPPTFVCAVMDYQSEAVMIEGYGRR